LLGVSVCLAWAGAALAIEDRADNDPSVPKQDGTIAWKLTATSLRETEQRSAIDLNLRGNEGANTFWLGHYQRGSEFLQTRAGYERQLEIPIGRIVGSAQLATRGFLGGSVTAELGTGSAFGLLGLGRTNLKTYYNLNFDPNDSQLYGAGWRQSKDTVLTLYQIRDDRLGTGQRVTHLVLRTKPERRTRWTIDLFRKKGYGGDADEAGERPSFKGTGFALAYDFEPWFVRVAWDPKVNFTSSDMLRVAGGMRF
jgi:hypothetical protein